MDVGINLIWHNHRWNIWSWFWLF